MFSLRGCCDLHGVRRFSGHGAAPLADTATESSPPPPTADGAEHPLPLGRGESILRVHWVDSRA
jgi:hypothetical protein